MAQRGEDGRPGIRGILAPVTRLDLALTVVFLGVLVTCVVRYLTRHPLAGTGTVVLAGAALLGAAYLTWPWTRGNQRLPTVWVVVMLGSWTLLTVLAPSFAWTAVPLAFAALQVLPFGIAAPAVLAMTVVVGAANSRIMTEFDPTVWVGPFGIALVTLIAMRSLDQQSRSRQALLDELTDAQAELLLAQRESGALAERTRLSREIHDSVGQQLSSINLLLQAAQQDWDPRPGQARALVMTAAGTAREGLDEVRRVVRDLAPAGVAGDADTLVAALERIVAGAFDPVAERAPSGELRVHGTPVSLGPAVSGAIVRTVRGALANVTEHAQASRVAVTLTYQDDEVRVDIRDDGRGFVVNRRVGTASGLRGHGLRGIVERAGDLGGEAQVESSPGEGTTVSVSFPVGARAGA